MLLELIIEEGDGNIAPGVYSLRDIEHRSCRGVGGLITQIVGRGEYWEQAVLENFDAT